jgi:hypothetical protein
VHYALQDKSSQAQSTVGLSMGYNPWVKQGSSPCTVLGRLWPAGEGALVVTVSGGGVLGHKEATGDRFVAEMGAAAY